MHHFHIEDANDGRVTKECSVEFEFDLSSHDSHRDRNLIGRMLGYVEKIQEIIRVDFSSFQ